MSLRTVWKLWQKQGLSPAPRRALPRRSFCCGARRSPRYAGVFSVMTASTANSIGVGGLPGILSMQPQSMGTFAIAMLIAVAVPFVLTVIIGKRKNIA